MGILEWSTAFACQGQMEVILWGSNSFFTHLSQEKKWRWLFFWQQCWPSVSRVCPPRKPPSLRAAAASLHRETPAWAAGCVWRSREAPESANRTRLAFRLGGCHVEPFQLPCSQGSCLLWAWQGRPGLGVWLCPALARWPCASRVARSQSVWPSVQSAY